MFQYATQPQSIGKVLDSGFKLFTFTFTKVVGLSLLAALISSLPNLISPGLHSNQPVNDMAAVTKVLWLVPFTAFISLIFYNAIYFRMDRAVTDPDKTFSDAMRVGLRKVLFVFLATILFILVVAVGAIALLIPGILFGLSLMFYQALIVIDDEGITAALNQSHRLVWGNWWRTLTVVSIPGIVILILYFAVGLAFGVFFAMSAGDVSATMEITLDFLITMLGALISPLFFAIILVQLNDLKLRRQGLDLEARLAK